MSSDGWQRKVKMNKIITVSATAVASNKTVKAKKEHIDATKNVAVESIKPSKGVDGIIGISLMLSDSGLKAIVGGVYVGIGNNNGKCCLKDYDVKKARKGYDSLSADYRESKGVGAYNAACTYLKARYSILDKDYDKLVALARAGVPLRTKSERKQASAIKVA